MSKKLKVVVFGVGFGQVYLNAIEKNKENYELVGIFSRGSDWSKECAKKYNVPLYTDINKIDKSICDVACVVIKSTIAGGKGSIVVEELLNKGINVIQEHPIHEKEFVKFIKLSKENGCEYFLNTFYPELNTIYTFIKTCKELQNITTIRHISADCSIHVLFPLIDIIGRAVGGLTPFEFKKVTSSFDLFFDTIIGYINNISITINIQNRIEPNNSENYMTLLHRIGITTNSGNLVLADTNGPIIWSPCMNKELYDDNHYNINDKNIFSDLPIYELIGENKNGTCKDILNEYWPDGVVNALELFRNSILNSIDLGKRNQYLLKSIRVWQEIGNILGTQKILSPYEKIPIKMDEILQTFSDM